MTLLKTLDELEEHPTTNNTNQIEEVFNIRVPDKNENQNIKQLDANLILSPRSTYSTSSQLSVLNPQSSKQNKSKLNSKKNSKKNKAMDKMSERSMSSMSNKSTIDEACQNEESQTNINNSTITDDPNTLTENSKVLFAVDYDALAPTQCADLSKISYANDTEKFLIKRLYSNVSKLHSILADLNSINLKYFLTTPDENDCLPLYYAIKAECTSSIKLLLDMGANLNKTTASGDPAPHLACLLGVSISLIDFLLSQHDQRYLYNNDQEGWTVLHCAANQGHINIVKYLLEGKFMNPNVKDGKNRNTCLQLAAVNNHISVIEYLLNFTSLSSITNKHEYGIDNKEVVNKKEDQNTTNATNVTNSTNNSNQIGNTSINHEETKTSNLTKRNSVSTSIVGSVNIANNSNEIKKNSASSSILKPPSLKMDLVEKSTHSNSIDSDKSIFHNLSNRSHSSNSSNLTINNLNKTITNYTPLSNTVSLKKAIQQSKQAKLFHSGNTSGTNSISNSYTTNTNRKTNHSNSISQISTISELDETTMTAETDFDTETDILSIRKKNRPRISIEPVSVYMASKRFLIEPVSIYNNFVIDVNSQNSEGQNVLHLAFRYGKYDVANLLLKKFGSHEIDINAVDFKGRTCMDLAWDWIINMNNNSEYKTYNPITDKKNKNIVETSSNPEKETDISSGRRLKKISLFYDDESSIYIQRDLLIDNEEIEKHFKLFDLINKYGGKFSSHKRLLYDLSLLKQLEEEVQLPSNLFHHVNDHISFRNLRLNLTEIVPLSVYLECILHLLKLNFPSMFLRKDMAKFRNANSNYLLNRPQTVALIERPSIKRAFTSISNFNDRQYEADEKIATKNYVNQIKQEFTNNLNDITKFIDKNVIDSFELQTYQEKIKTAFELLSRF